MFNQFNNEAAKVHIFRETAKRNSGKATAEAARVN